MAIVKWLRIGWDEQKKKQGKMIWPDSFIWWNFIASLFPFIIKKMLWHNTVNSYNPHTHSRTQTWLLLTTILFLFSLAFYELNFWEYCLDSCHSLKAFQNRNMQWNYNWSSDKMKFHLHTNLWKFFAISCPQ